MCRRKVREGLAVRRGSLYKICEGGCQLLNDGVGPLLVPLWRLLRIVCLVEAGAACRLGDFPGAMGVVEMFLEFLPVLVSGRLVAKIRAGMVNLLGVGDDLESNADDSFV